MSESQSSLPDGLETTSRTRVRRAHQRGAYDRATINAILDASPLCHVGYILDGKPAVTPTLQWREGNVVYWHGSSASRALKKASGLDVCLTVSILDGLVMARSAFHHSANYRSVMIYGKSVEITDHALKLEKLKTFTQTLYPGRWEQLREINDQEIKATTIIGLPIEEASAKIRTGPPSDDEEDYDLPIWAGALPISQSVGEPEPDPRNLNGVSMPPSLNDIKIG